MDRVDLKVGFACNNRCVFCVQGDKRARVPPSSTEEVLDRMRQARARNRGIVLTGGEVTLRKDYFTLLQAARELGYHPVQVQTNGRRFHDPAFCVASVRAGATEFSPSLHGSTAAIHDALTRSRSFSQTCQGILNLVAMGQVVITNSVVTRANLGDLPRLVRLLHRLGVRQVQLALVHPLGTAADRFPEVVPRLAEAAPPTIEALRLARSLGLHAVTEALPPCLLGDLADAAVEPSIPRTEIFDADVHMDDYTRYRTETGKKKGAACARCVLEPTCEGPWKEYLDAYGEGDLRPVERG